MDSGQNANGGFQQFGTGGASSDGVGKPIFSGSAGVSGGAGNVSRGFASTMTSGPVFSDSGMASKGVGLTGGRKSLRWLVVLAVALVFVVAGGVAFALWKGGASGGENGGQTSSLMSDDAKLAFNAYANFVFWGNDSTDEVEIPSLWIRANALANAVDNTDAAWRVEYFDKVARLQETFLGHASGTVDNTTVETDSLEYKYSLLLSTMPLNLSTLKIVGSIGKPTVEEIIVAVRGSGVDAAVQKYMGQYTAIIDTDNGTIYGTVEEFYENYANYVKLLDDNGCIGSDGSLDYICIGDAENANVEAVTNYYDAMRNYDTMVSSYVSSVLNNCVNLKNLLNGVGDEQES